MSGTDWPILSAVAETLKQNSGMKIQIADHDKGLGGRISPSKTMRRKRDGR